MRKSSSKDKAIWKCKSSEKNLGIEFISKYKDYLDFKLVCQYSFMTISDILEYKLEDYIDWTTYVLYQKHDPEYIWNNPRLVDWSKVSRSPVLSDYVMDQHGTFLDWNLVTARHKFDEEILIRFKDHIDWEQACISQKLSSYFLDKYYIQLRVYLYEISKYQKLSEEYMRKHKDDLDWDIISEYQNLSETFMEEMSDYINWTWVSEKQKISKEFISKNVDKLNLTRLINRKVSLPSEIKNSEYFKIYKIYTNRNRIMTGVG